ncbi:MAG: methyltransferase [Bacteroidota bacterium]
MSSIFKFKHFEVDQNGCAMKINTDGVLLAALANFSLPTVPVIQKTCLDIGTGTGVMAMVLAQRFPDAFIDAVEIDEQASVAAAKNFSNSQFASRLKVIHADITMYNTTSRYDLIVSNPPFFVNDLKNTEARKSVARHAGETFFESLLSKVATLLTANGQFWVILPVKQADFLIEKSLHFGLHVTEEIAIHSDETKPVIRKIISLGRSAAQVKKENFYIYKEQGIHTDAYKALLSDFFLAF